MKEKEARAKFRQVCFHLCVFVLASIHHTSQFWLVLKTSCLRVQSRFKGCGVNGVCVTAGMVLGFTVFFRLLVSPESKSHQSENGARRRKKRIQVSFFWKIYFTKSEA